MKIPETSSTDGGLIVEGADADLLAALLDAYGFELRRQSTQTWESMKPGRSRQEVVDLLSSAGVEPLDELVVWWAWRDGFLPGASRIGVGHPLLRLEQALFFRREDEQLAFELLPDPSWIRVGGDGMRDSIAVSFADSSDPPVVRFLDPEIGDRPGRDVISLCTPVAWWLTGLERGWTRFDETWNAWRMEQVDWERFPAEWKLTGLV
jgi:hypothetical protein